MTEDAEALAIEVRTTGPNPSKDRLRVMAIARVTWPQMKLIEQWTCRFGKGPPRIHDFGNRLFRMLSGCRIIPLSSRVLPFLRAELRRSGLDLPADLEIVHSDERRIAVAPLLITVPRKDSPPASARIGNFLEG